MTATLEETSFLSKAEMLELIQPTEEIEERLFDLNANVVKFTFDEKTEEPPKVILSGDVFELTSEAYMNACQIVGLGRAYSTRTPIELIVPHLNYWFANLGGQRKVLIRGKKAVAFIRPGTEIYSTKKLIEAIYDKFESLGYKDIVFDKVYHDLLETQFSVVLRDKFKESEDGEILYGGLQFQNSILGLKPLVVSAYVNHSVDEANGGMISVTTTGQWDRRLGTSAQEISEFLERGIEFDPEDVYSVYDWVEQATSDVNLRLEKEFAHVNRLKGIGVGSHAGVFFNDIYKKYNIPISLRKAVQEEYTDRDGNAVYDLWAAFVAVTSRHEVRGNPSAMRHMMTVAGELAAHPERCNECNRLKDLE